jgi:sugar lactone lactonase YvrE
MRPLPRIAFLTFATACFPGLLQAQTSPEALEGKVDALAAAVSRATSSEAAKSLVDVALSLLQDALDKDRFDIAVRVGKVAEATAAKTNDRGLIETVAARAREIAPMRQAYERLQPARDRLAKNPENADANLEMGRYLALVKGNWETALFYLAQGSDRELRLLAQRDLARPEEPADQLRVADAWWAVAGKGQGAERIHMQQRAVHWYEMALDSTHGFKRGRLEERIASVPRSYVSSFGWDYDGRPGELRAFTGHNSTVYGVAFSPDGKKIVSGSMDGRAILWDAATGRQLFLLQGHGGMIWAVAYSFDGKHVFTSSWDGTVKMWDAAQGTEVKHFPGQGRIADINGVAVSRDGKQLLTGSDDGVLRLWDIASGQERQFPGHQGFVYGVAFSPDGRRALSGGAADRQMMLWDLQAGKELRRFTGLHGQLRTVAFSPDGHKAVHAGGNEVTLWDLQTGQPSRQFRGHSGAVNAVAFSPDGRRLATGGSDRTIRLWDVASGREVHRFDAHTEVFALAFSRGGGRLASGGQDNAVRLWGLPR